MSLESSARTLFNELSSTLPPAVGLSMAVTAAAGRILVFIDKAYFWSVPKTYDGFPVTLRGENEFSIKTIGETFGLPVTFVEDNPDIDPDFDTTG